MKMIKSIGPWFILAALMGVLVSGCYMPGLAPSPTTDILLFTQVAKTFVAELTLTAPAATGTPIPSTTQAETATPAATEPPATDTPVPSPTEEPTSTPEPTISQPETTATETLNVIFEEDFEDETGWFTADNDDFTFEFDRDSGDSTAYRVINRTRNGAIWSIREVDELDIRLEVDAGRSGGPENGLFGLVCRHVDEDNYYALMVSSSGEYAIAKMEDGEMENEAEGTVPAGLIPGGEASVHIRADCVGDTLALYVNGQELARVDDDDFGSGAVGLVTRTNPEPGLDVLFDNFRIIRP